jgi:hypothetical protein
MNKDDFEKQLERQSLRQPPAAWREAILATARANIRPASSATESDLLVGWRAFLARIPLAWGAVAAVWAVIIGVNLLMAGPSVAVMAGSANSTSQEKLTLWSLQRAEMSLLADHLIEPPAPAPRPPAVTPAPRSDRRREEGFGGLDGNWHYTTIA